MKQVFYRIESQRELGGIALVTLARMPTRGAAGSSAMIEEIAGKKTVERLLLAAPPNLERSYGNTAILWA